MDHSVTIRDAGLNDIGMLASIIRESFRDIAVRFSLTPENCPKHPSNCTTAWIESDMDRGVQYFILSLDSDPKGCVGLENPSKDSWYLERLSVLPEMRCQGFGHSLVHHALEHAASKGAHKISIGIIADHAELKRWYKDIGFADVQTKSFQHLPFRVDFMEFKLDKTANQANSADAKKRRG